MGVFEMDESPIRDALDMGSAGDRHGIALDKVLQAGPHFILGRGGKAGENEKDGGQFGVHHGLRSFVGSQSESHSPVQFLLHDQVPRSRAKTMGPEAQTRLWTKR